MTDSIRPEAPEAREGPKRPIGVSFATAAEIFTAAALAGIGTYLVTDGRWQAGASLIAVGLVFGVIGLVHALKGIRRQDGAAEAGDQEQEEED